MTPEQQRDIWYKFHRLIKRYGGYQKDDKYVEGIYSIKFNIALKEQVKQYIDSGTLMSVTSTPIYKVLVQLYKEIAIVWAHKSALQIRRHKSRQPLGFSERIVELMKTYYGIDLLNDAEGITETTRKMIQKVLDDAALAGWSYDEIVNKLEGPITRNRARLIARTEVVTAANGAAVINAKETAIKTGLELNKIWIAAKDSRTRFDHRQVDQRVIGINDNFIVGTSVMSQPGDRSKGAEADEICNCRCCVAFIPVED